MNPRLKITIFLLFFVLFSIVPISSHAQVPTSIDGVQISLTPEMPSPGQPVTIDIQSFSTNLGAASIVWLLDGKSFQKGIGKTSITLKAPSLGRTIVILADIMTVEGKEVKKAINLRSGGVDLIWESQGYVPPFYKGRAGFAFQNPVQITAIPHLAGPGGTELPPSSLVYKWTSNDKVVLDQSGYGKQTITLSDDVPQPFDVVVDVTTANGSDKASSRITITPGDPSILFYEDDPLYGVLYNKALTNNVSLANQEISLRATPYLFTFSKNIPLTYNWSVNNLERQDLSTNESITLRPKGDVEGSSDISLEIRNRNQILQGARNAVSVLFSKRRTDEANATFQ
jgi:hypothetical protein